MKKIFFNFVVGLTVVFFCGLAIAAVSYDHEVEDNGVQMFWKVTDSELHIKIIAETTGWVGVGFNPTEQMKDANYIIGYVKDGEAVVHDHFGHEKWNHREDTALGGSRDLTVVGGEEKDGRTTLEFSLPLDSGDDYDAVIDGQGKTVLLLAYGGSRDSLRSMHRYRTTLTIRLAEGRRE